MSHCAAAAPPVPQNKPLPLRTAVSLPPIDPPKNLHREQRYKTNLHISFFFFLVHLLLNIQFLYEIEILALLFMNGRNFNLKDNGVQREASVLRDEV